MSQTTAHEASDSSAFTVLSIFSDMWYSFIENLLANAYSNKEHLSFYLTSKFPYSLFQSEKLSEFTLIQWYGPTCICTIFVLINYEYLITFTYLHITFRSVYAVLQCLWCRPFDGQFFRVLHLVYFTIGVA